MLNLTDKVRKFGIGDKKRKYIAATLNFETARKVFSPERYRAETGVGEQRELVMAHVKTLRKEMEDGNFTPTSVSVGFRDKQEGVTLVENDGNATVTLADGASLPLTDGGHRFAALEYLFEDEKYKTDIGSSDITAIILLDGNTKKDFLNLQKGRPVDKSHLHSLSIQEKLVKEKDLDVLTLAYETAKLLNSDEKSPFYKQIRFDSTGVSGIPISSLISKGASDIATSLVGGAKIAMHANKDAAWLAKCVTTAFIFLNDKAKDLMAVGAKLCPPPQGTKGSATMLIGMGNMLAYRLYMQGLDSADTADVLKLVEAANKTLNGAVGGNFSGPMKRNAMGDFADKFFADVVKEDENHYGVPRELVKLLSTSTFSVPKLEKKKKEKAPKVSKPKKEKKPKKQKEVSEEQQENIEADNSELFDNAPPVEAPKVEVTEKAPWEEDEMQG